MLQIQSCPPVSSDAIKLVDVRMHVNSDIINQSRYVVARCLRSVRPSTFFQDRRVHVSTSILGNTTHATHVVNPPQHTLQTTPGNGLTSIFGTDPSRGEHVQENPMVLVLPGTTVTCSLLRVCARCGGYMGLHAASPLQSPVLNPPLIWKLQKRGFLLITVGHHCNKGNRPSESGNRIEDCV